MVTKAGVKHICHLEKLKIIIWITQPYFYSHIHNLHPFIINNGESSHFELGGTIKLAKKLWKNLSIRYNKISIVYSTMHFWSLTFDAALDCPLNYMRNCLGKRERGFLNSVLCHLSCLFLPERKLQWRKGRFLQKRMRWVFLTFKG